MMEFTMSKVTLCICGVALLAIAVGLMDGLGEEMEEEGLQDVADNVATMLDGFWHSDVDSITIPHTAVPGPGYGITVADNLVTAHGDDGSASSVTEYPGSFEMGFGYDLELSRRTSPRP